MHEAGFIKSNPQRTDGSNLRFLDEQARAEDVSMRGLVLTRSRLAPVRRHERIFEYSRFVALEKYQRQLRALTWVNAHQRRVLSLNMAG
jgi:hypothetical protein